MRLPLLTLSALALSGCAAVDTVANVGRAPRFSRPTEVPAPAVEPSIATSSRAEPQAQTASLFRDGAAGLFRDNRAHARGDLLVIRVSINDSAAMNNTTSRTRAGNENASIAGLLGLDRLIDRILPGKPTSAGVSGDSQSKAQGSGSINRGEAITMTLAAVVTEVLPNGNLAIRGRQEIRVNNELRELVITGLIRPQDIGRDNSIRHHQIAEARVLYGGRGQLTSAQQARWGQQIYDALFPF